MDVMLIVMKSKYFKTLKESLKLWFPKEDTKGYVLQVKEELNRMIKENKDFMRDKVSRYYGLYVLFVVAVHNVIKEKYCSQEILDKDLLDMMNKINGHRFDPNLEKVKQSPDIYKEFISMSKYYIKKSFDNKHFGLRIIEDTNKRFRYRISKCLAHKILGHLGVPELTRLFCEADKSLMNVMENSVAVKSNKLISNGDEYCDWCFDKIEIE